MKEKLSRKLAQNVEALKDIFQDSSDLVYRTVQFTESRQGLVVYIEGMVDTKGVEQLVIAPLIEGLVNAERQVERLSELPFTRIALTQMATVSDWTDVIEAILTAHVVIFMDDSNEALTCDVKGGPDVACKSRPQRRLFAGRVKDLRNRCGSILRCFASRSRLTR
ncbi:spore germination protein [Paenibacillus sp. D2_2]|nr:spore germination protein [Paenibacillus sp. D2_2]WMT40745.1 spore germination protein [Paenibacillus sp. D2_2]